MPGAGKAVVVEVAKKLGHEVIVMGDEVRIETKRRGLEPTSQSMGEVMLKMRSEEGSTVVAERCIPKIEKLKSKIIIVDGIRSVFEADAFRKRFPDFMLLGIHASPKTRYNRLFKRKRNDDPTTWQAFLERDRRELQVGLGSVIASADLMVINEGRKVELKKNIESLLEKVRIGENRWQT